MSRWLLSLLLLLSGPVFAAEDIPPSSDTALGDNNTSCNATREPSIDEDPDTPGGDWCTADNNNVDWSFTVQMGNPSGALDDGTDLQTIALYVRSFDEGQTGVPDIRVDVYDGLTCIDLHETGAEISLTDAGFPALATDTWTSAGLSSPNDVCFAIVCTKSGGSPSSRNSCDIDAIEWRAELSAAATPQAIVISGE